MSVRNTKTAVEKNYLPFWKARNIAAWSRRAESVWTWIFWVWEMCCHPVKCQNTRHRRRLARHSCKNWSAGLCSSQRMDPMKWASRATIGEGGLFGAKQSLFLSLLCFNEFLPWIKNDKGRQGCRGCCSHGENCGRVGRESHSLFRRSLYKGNLRLVK